MNQVNIISDLVKWIEKNLEQPLSIDNVAKKSGYSKWHLQRMFKEVSGQILGTYIRHRRLTHSALALKMTGKPILEIAMQYRFDSQQTFTRSFKSQFGLTPAAYRKKNDWDLSGLSMPIQLNKKPVLLPEPEFVWLPSQTFWGISYKSNANLTELLDEKSQRRVEFYTNYLNKYFERNAYLPSKLYTFATAAPHKDNQDEQEIIHTVALKKNSHMDGMTEYHHEEGLYACFKFVGHHEAFIDFVIHLHLAALPALNVKRRNSCNIEVHYCNDKSLTCVGEIENIECDYYIPIITDDKEIEKQSQRKIATDW